MAAQVVNFNGMKGVVKEGISPEILCSRLEQGRQAPSGLQLALMERVSTKRAMASSPLRDGQVATTWMGRLMR